MTMEDNVISYLNLTEVTHRDGGTYACSASNNAGTVTHEEEIRVFGKRLSHQVTSLSGPPFVRSVGPVAWSEGEDIVLACPVSGYPISGLTWHFGGDNKDVIVISSFQVESNSRIQKSTKSVKMAAC